MRYVACILFVLGCLTLLACRGSAAQLNPGDLIVVDPHSNFLPGQGVIVAINPTTGAQTLISQTSMLEQPSGLAIDASGDLIVSDYGYIGPGGIYRVDVETGVPSLISSGNILNHATSVAIDSSGMLVVAQQGPSQAQGAVLRIDPDTGDQSLFSSGGPFHVAGHLAIEPDGNYLGTSFQAPSALVRISSSDGTQTVVSQGGELEFGPHGFWISSLTAHSALVARAGLEAVGQVVKIDTVTGQQTVISAGGLLDLPIGVTQDALGNIFVTDAGRVLKIDPTTGQQTIVSAGGYLSTPGDILIYVPEPSSIVLLALAAGPALVGFARRTRARKPSSRTAISVVKSRIHANLPA